jgi:hypothetical protein
MNLLANTKTPVSAGAEDGRTQQRLPATSLSSAARLSTFADCFGGPVALRRRIAPTLLLSESIMSIDLNELFI